jgi:glycosyltransferase involved in cell wall biosynthesis
MLKIAAIVPTRNRAETVSTCIDSLLNQTLPSDEFEIIIVDNSSTDATKAVVERFSKQSGGHVRYILSKEVGSHHARNVGAKAASAEILAYTDDDAICDSHWLEALLEAYEHKDVGCAGGKIIVKWDEKPPDWLKPYEILYGKLDYGSTCRVLLPHEPIFGANYSLRKNVLMEAGGFHPELIGTRRVGDGETGLFCDLISNGVKAVWVPKAVVWHLQKVKYHGTLEYLKGRFKDLGVDLACRELRGQLPVRSSLFARGIAATAYWCAFKSLAEFSQFRNSSKLISRKLSACYYWGRATYLLELIYQDQLRDYVSRRSWLEQ